MTQSKYLEVDKKNWTQDRYSRVGGPVDNNKIFLHIPEKTKTSDVKQDPTCWAMGT